MKPFLLISAIQDLDMFRILFNEATGTSAEQTFRPGSLCLLLA